MFYILMEHLILNAYEPNYYPTCNSIVLDPNYHPTRNSIVLDPNYHPTRNSIELPYSLNETLIQAT